MPSQQTRMMVTRMVVTDTNVTITSTFQSSQLVDTFARDGSLDTNLQTAYIAHKNAVLNEPPPVTAPSIVVSPKGQWVSSRHSSTTTTIAGKVQTFVVPSGSTGVIKLTLDPGSATAQYKKNAGSWTTFTDGTTLSGIVTGDTLSIQGLSMAVGDTVSGSILDNGTSMVIDVFNYVNVDTSQM